LGPQEVVYGRIEDWKRGNLLSRNIFRQFLHARSGQISGITAKEGRTQQEGGHLPPEGEQTYPVGEVTHA
jgi:hypothetical protein